MATANRYWDFERVFQTLELQGPQCRKPIIPSIPRKHLYTQYKQGYEYCSVRQKFIRSNTSRPDAYWSEANVAGCLFDGCFMVEVAILSQLAGSLLEATQVDLKFIRSTKIRLEVY